MVHRFYSLADLEFLEFITASDFCEHLVQTSHQPLIVTISPQAILTLHRDSRD